MIRHLSIGAIITGLAAQLAGLALDAVLHARDPSLAGREGVLTLSNPGHLLFASGLALAVIGVAGMVTPWDHIIGRGAGRTALGAVPATLLLTLAAGAFAVATRSGGLSGHSHATASLSAETTSAEQAAAHAHAHVHTPSALQASTSNTDASRHDHGAEINISWEQLREIDALLTRAKAATEKYRDVETARADGYIQVTQVLPRLGAHFVQPALLAAGVFDPERPPILLYDATPDGGFELVGVSWSLPKKAGDSTPPATPFGPLATWHYHTDLCFSVRGGGPTVAVRTAAACRAAGGAWVRETGWMVHAWLFRPSPEGIFSHQNSTITGGSAGAAVRP